MVDRLWSPWRLAYVTGTSKSTTCVFCDALGAGGESALLVHRSALAYVILNLYPYNNGHLMVVPNRHIGSLAEATREELAEMMLLSQHAEHALTEAYAPHGLNIGINLGKAAGAGVLDHLHIHIVPRWNGDTNFMSVVGEVRVLPEQLDVTAARLRPIFERVAATSS